MQRVINTKATLRILRRLIALGNSQPGSSSQWEAIVEEKTEAFRKEISALRSKDFVAFREEKLATAKESLVFFEGAMSQLD